MIVEDICDEEAQNQCNECNICFEVDEFLCLECSHHLCYTCHEKWFIENLKETCPFCRCKIQIIRKTNPMHQNRLHSNPNLDDTSQLQNSRQLNVVQSVQPISHRFDVSTHTMLFTIVSTGFTVIFIIIVSLIINRKRTV